MAETSYGDVTRLLDALARGETEASERLFAIVYHDLRKLAAAAMRRERGDHTLQPTALVHEAFIRLAGQHDASWESRSHFFAIAATAMRRVLCDHARRRGAQKRPGTAVPMPTDGPEPFTEPSVDLIALDLALEQLGQLDPRIAQVVELRFFGGFSVEETAAILGVSPRTVKREWQFARAWLKQQIST